MSAERKYEAPSSGEKLFNRAFGFLAGLGIAPSFIYLLKVRGRKSGKLYSTAVNLLEVDGKQFLVAPRGRTQWVRNAEAAGEVTLKRGPRRRFRLRLLDDSEKPQVLNPGDTVNIPPDTMHWHGAAPDRLFSHLALSEAGEQGQGTAWGTHVSDAEYNEVASGG